MEAICQGGCDFLRHGANLHAMHVPVFAQAVIDEIHDAGGDGEAQAFAAAARREDESVDANDRAIHIDERSAAVAGVDGRVGLDVGQWLSRDRAGGRPRSRLPW